ncbi:hypothetical protein [[Phormidium] sp. ETS-05]|uniref:hypothetical protein n=1 Tax=[Phormidium] sp. ETS-05 TaxID=222819 RepID=UPI0018EF19A2|nr:hypothetical protein [[Phormidium] sp. ETS-05]
MAKARRVLFMVSWWLSHRARKQRPIASPTERRRCKCLSPLERKLAQKLDVTHGNSSRND